METLSVFLHNLGLGSFRLRGQVRPAQLQRVLQAAQDTPYKNIISAIMLRSMKKALYTTDPRGHFGLAAEDYCYFTSPIRRYPDLLVHRMIRYSAAPNANEKELAAMRARLEELAVQSSERERRAMEAERDAEDYLMALYMQAHVGEPFAGIISGITEHGFFVQLENLAEGFVSVRSLQGWYLYDEKNYCLRLENSNERYSLGDTVEILVDDVNLETRKIDFSLIRQKRKVRVRRESKPKTRKAGRRRR